MESVTVRVPATTANLACGFDTLGCALGLYNTLRFTLSDSLSFSGCDKEFQNEDNLAYQAFRAVFEAVGRPVPPVRIDIYAEIPVCRGLGSSAAMLAAGAVAADALGGFGMSREELLAVVTPIEGHPDNLAPALFGGMTASMYTGGKAYYAAFPVSPELRFVVLSPDYTLSTHAARAALPEAVPYADAIFSLPRLALLPKALENADEELLSLCLSDRLHQPYRSPLIPGLEDVRSIAEKLGCRCFCISGAGPSLLCISRAEGFAGRLRAAVGALPHGWAVRDLAVDPDGADIVEA